MTSKRFPLEAQPGFKALVAALYDDFHPRNLRVYVNVPAHDEDFDMKFLADHSDGLLLMNYDEHETGSGPGPIASQDWFIDNLKWALKVVPKDKIICAIGSYGYDWTTTLRPPGRKAQKASVPEKVLSVASISTQQAWQQAYDSHSHIDLDDDSLNVHFAYDDDDAHVRHYVWFLDAVTAMNEMRAARELGIQTDCALASGTGGQLSLEDLGRPASRRSRQRPGPGSAQATTSIPKAKATSCASHESLRTARAISPWMTTIPSLRSTAWCCRNRWSPTRSRTP